MQDRNITIEFTEGCASPALTPQTEGAFWTSNPAMLLVAVSLCSGEDKSSVFELLTTSSISQCKVTRSFAEFEDLHNKVVIQITSHPKLPVPNANAATTLQTYINQVLDILSDNLFDAPEVLKFLDDKYDVSALLKFQVFNYFTQIRALEQQFKGQESRHVALCQVVQDLVFRLDSANIGSSAVIPSESPLMSLSKRRQSDPQISVAQLTANNLRMGISGLGGRRPSIKRRNSLRSVTSLSATSAVSDADNADGTPPAIQQLGGYHRRPSHLTDITDLSEDFDYVDEDATNHETFNSSPFVSEHSVDLVSEAMRSRSHSTDSPSANPAAEVSVSGSGSALTASGAVAATSAPEPARRMSSLARLWQITGTSFETIAEEDEPVTSSRSAVADRVSEGATTAADEPCHTAREDEDGEDESDEAEEDAPFFAKALCVEYDLIPSNQEPVPLDEVMEDLLSMFQPHEEQVAHRGSILTTVMKLTKRVLGTRALEVGLHSIRCFLPDDGIKLGVVPLRVHQASWHVSLSEKLLRLSEGDPGTVEEMEDLKFFGFFADESTFPILNDHSIMAVAPPNATEPKVVVTIDSINIELAANPRLDLATLVFFEEFSGLVGKNHLFKRSLLVIRAWWTYETTAHAGNPIKHYLSDFTITVMVCAIFNQYHSRIHHPIQALSIFLAEYSCVDWESHAVTVQGIVAFSSEEGEANVPAMRKPGSKHLISGPMLAKYWEMNTPPGHSMGGAPADPALLKKTPVGLLEANSMYAVESWHVLKGFMKSEMNIVHPLAHTNMVGGSINTRRLGRIVKAMQTAAKALNATLKIAATSSISIHTSINSFFRGICSRFGTGWRPDVYGNTLVLSNNAVKQKAKSKADAEIEVAARIEQLMKLLTCSSSLLVGQSDYCSLLLDGRVTDAAIIFICKDILQDRGSLPVGEVGKTLQDSATVHHLSHKLKEKYGGLKKFLEMYESEFVMGPDHPFNPHVFVRKSLSPDDLEAINRGIIPPLCSAKSKKQMIATARRNRAMGLQMNSPDGQMWPPGPSSGGPPGQRGGKGFSPQNSPNDMYNPQYHPNMPHGGGPPFDGGYGHMPPPPPAPHGHWNGGPMRGGNLRGYDGGNHAPDMRYEQPPVYDQGYPDARFDRSIREQFPPDQRFKRGGYDQPPMDTRHDRGNYQEPYHLHPDAGRFAGGLQEPPMSMPDGRYGRGAREQPYNDPRAPPPPEPQQYPERFERGLSAPFPDGRYDRDRYADRSPTEGSPRVPPSGLSNSVTYRPQIDNRPGVAVNYNLLRGGASNTAIPERKPLYTDHNYNVSGLSSSTMSTAKVSAQAVPFKPAGGAAAPPHLSYSQKSSSSRSLAGGVPPATSDLGQLHPSMFGLEDGPLSLSSPPMPPPGLSGSGSGPGLGSYSRQAGGPMREDSALINDILGNSFGGDFGLDSLSTMRLSDAGPYSSSFLQ